MSQFSMKPLSDRIGKPEWENHIRAWEKSGFSKAKYCRRKHISYHAFNYWKKRLEKPKPPSPITLVKLEETEKMT